MRHKIKRIGVALVLSALSACAAIRSIVADFDMDATASVTDDSGRIIQPAVPLSKIGPPPRASSPFADLQYEGSMLSAHLQINSVFVQMLVTNRSNGPITLHFDQATISSNFESREIPLRAFRATMQGALVPRRQEGLLTVPPMHLRPGERGLMDMGPSYHGLFPNGRVFGLQTEPKDPVLLASGIGNTVRLRIPVESAGARSFLMFEVTAKNTLVRSSYY